jgi:hypothetical protein
MHEGKVASDEEVAAVFELPIMKVRYSETALRELDEIAKFGQGINADMGEALVWMREPALGYPKHPPLSRGS